MSWCSLCTFLALSNPFSFFVHLTERQSNKNEEAYYTESKVESHVVKESINNAKNIQPWFFFATSARLIPSLLFSPSHIKKPKADEDNMHLKTTRHTKKTAC